MIRSFKEFLLAEKVSLSLADIKKVRNGELRIITLHNLITKGNPLIIDGVPTVVKFISKEAEKAFKTGDLHSPFLANARIKVFKDKEGKEYSVSEVEKSPDLGGGKGSGGGSENTDYTESAQCVYAQALWDNPSTTYSAQDLKSAYTKVKVTASLEQIMSISQAWIQSSIIGAGLLRKSLSKTKYTFHRGSPWVIALNGHFRKLNIQEGSIFSNVNKWSPADMWAIKIGKETRYDFLSTSTLLEFNSMLMEAYKNLDIVGISLKELNKSSTVKHVNYEGQKSVGPKYKDYILGRKDFYSAKDSYIFADDGTQIQFRTFPDNWMGEIKGKHSSNGKIGLSPINTILQRLKLKPLETQGQIRSEIETNKNKFLTKFYNVVDAEEIISDTLPVFKKKLQDKDTGWLLSKYFCTMLYVTLKNKKHAQMFMDSVLSYASSQSDLSAVHMKLI